MKDKLKYGNEYNIVGVVFGRDDSDRHTLLMPGEKAIADEYLLGNWVSHGSQEELSSEQWQELIRQTDLLEVQVVDPEDKHKKAIVRKTQRQIDQHTSWKVYKRDGYKCRYCANDDTPLTVDHLVTWETGDQQ